MNLSLRQLTVFREVMRSGSISQAAKTVARTQPAVSTMMATLEQELGFPLFLREHGKLTPTPEAHYFLEEAEAILARLERTKQALSKISALETGRLRIACHPAASGLFMPRLLTGFLKDKAGVELSLIMRSSGVIEDLVASQQFDIGFAETPRPRASIDQTDFDLECVCVLRHDDPLARNRTLSPEELDGKPMAVLFDDHPTATQTEHAFTSRGRKFNKWLELRTFMPGLQFVSDGFCYMICDMITAYSHLVQGSAPSRLVMRRFLPTVTSSVSILTPAYVSQARLSQAFAAHLSSALQEMQLKVEGLLTEGMDAAPDDPPTAGQS